MRVPSALLLAALACATAAVDASAGCTETEDAGSLKSAAFNCSQELAQLQKSFENAVAAKDMSAQNTMAEKIGADLYTYRRLEVDAVRSLKEASLSDEQGLDLQNLRESMDRYLSENSELAKIASTAAEPPPSLSQDDEALLAEPRTGSGQAAPKTSAAAANDNDGKSGPARQTQSLDNAGDAALAAGNVDQAHADYQKAAQASPKDATPLLRLAALSERQGDVDAAKGYIQQAIAADPASEAAKIALGHADELESAGAKTRAASPFDKKQAEQTGAGGDPATVAIPSDLSQDYASALAALSPPKSPALPFIRDAERKRGLGDKTAALLAATQAIDADRQNAAAWTIRADIDNDLKNYDGAVGDATEALRLRPQDPQALRARAYALLQLGRLEEALADIRRATELDPANGTGWLYRAMIEEKLGDLESAKRDYLEAVRLDPALKPLAAEAFARLGLGGAAPDQASRWAIPKNKVMRGAAIAISLLFVLLGLLGTAPGRAITTTARRALSRPEAEAATVLDEPAQALGPGALIGGHYRIERELGRGGMGVVYAAVDESLQRPVAIKRLQRDAGATSDDLERFLREARLVAKLRHANIAEIYAVLERPELLLVFEFVEGRPLDALLSERRRLPAAEAAKIVDDVCSALAYAHAQKIIHRDLKPSNVMIAPNGACKVMDFGIAHQARSGATLTQTMASGTPPYMAPEQTLGSNSAASDLYALAAMAYELVTGVRPFEGPDYLEQKLQKRYRREASFSPAAAAFFETAFEPDPTKRHPGAEAFARAFRSALA